MIGNPSPITRFEILGLYGDRDIILDFDSPIKILVNENGSGKTTVLNTLFNLISGNWEKLAELEFGEIRIHFPKNKEIILDIYGLESNITFIRSRNRKAIQEIMSRLDKIPPKKNSISRLRVTEIPRHTTDQLPESPGLSQSTNLVREVLLDSEEQEQPNLKLSQISEALQKLFPYPILYFPTYRRIEEDLHTLGYVEGDINRDEQLIHFGMRDVEGRFERITDQIRDSSVEWYSIINGRMLTQLIEGPKLEASMLDSLNDPAALGIVLERVGEHISQGDKKHLLKLVKSGEIRQAEYKTLAYFLSNLLQVYEQQREKDHAIKNFARVTNGYLEDKEVRYNESKVEIKILNKRSGQEMPLDKLSSGEKQIISIFSRLYLEDSPPVAILFDEPELSLSIEWQRKLLQDIVDSEKCIFLLAATHSPFIFDNELDQFASLLEIRYREGEDESS